MRSISVLLDLSGINDLLLDSVQSDLLVAYSDANYQDSHRCDDLRGSDPLIENEDVGEHGVDDIHEADEGDEAGITTLECNSLTHYSNGVEQCSSK